MQRIFHFFLDFLFPPSPESIKLRSLSPKEMLRDLPKAEPSPLPWVTSLFSYKNPLVKELVLSIKNKKDQHAVRCAAFALYKNVKPPALLIPIPISKRRRNERGYNQCELIIDEILKLDQENQLSKNYSLLVRAKDRGEQKTKNREERLDSTHNIFTVNPEPITTPIVVIDDVCTTGSTLKEARDALIKAGYENVTSLTLAH